MSVWKDLYSNPPPVDGANLYFRRLNTLGPEIFGTVSLATQTIAAGISGGPAWLCPFSSLTHWRFNPVTDFPPWPGPGGHGPWHDPFWVPPTDGLAVYVRRWPSDTHAYHAYWRAATASFELHPSGWLIPWHMAARWKPYEST